MKEVPPHTFLLSESEKNWLDVTRFKCAHQLMLGGDGRPARDQHKGRAFEHLSNASCAKWIFVILCGVEKMN